MRSSRKLYISIRKLKCHEFHTTLRKLHRDNRTWSRRFDILSGIEARAIKQFVRMFGQNVVAYLILTSLRTGNFLQINVLDFEASIPASYFMAASSFVLLFTAISLCHLSVAMSLKVTESYKLLLPGFSANIYGLILQDKDDTSLGIASFSNYFIKEKFPISTSLVFSIFLGLLAALLPLSAFGYYLFNQQLSIFLDDSVLLIERITSCFGMVLSVSSALYVTLFHLPMPCRKNTASIRWSFLYYLPYEGSHPQITKWIKKN